MRAPVIMERTIQVEHVMIKSRKPFAEVRAALESLVPQLDTLIFVLLQRGESERARTELEGGPELAIFSARDHGGLLRIAGLARRAVQYEMATR